MPAGPAPSSARGLGFISDLVMESGRLQRVEGGGGGQASDVDGAHLHPLSEDVMNGLEVSHRGDIGPSLTCACTCSRSHPLIIHQAPFQVLFNQRMQIIGHRPGSTVVLGGRGGGNL